MAKKNENIKLSISCSECDIYKNKKCVGMEVLHGIELQFCRLSNPIEEITPKKKTIIPKSTK